MDKSNIELSHLSQCYDAYSKSDGMSSYTLEWHRDVLQQFHDWLVSEHKPTTLGSLGEEEVRG